VTRVSWLWAAIIGVSALGIGVLTFGEIQSPLRPVIALWFLFVCPGMALVRLLGLRERLTEVTLAIALSLVMDAIVSVIMLYMGDWSPKLTLLILIGISMGGVAFQIVVAYSRSKPLMAARRMLSRP
jgi:uncharacterized membrane protein